MDIKAVQTKPRPKANGDPPDMPSCILPCQDDGSHGIPRVEPEARLRPPLMPGREAVLIRPTHLACAMPCRSDDERVHAAHDHALWRTGPDTSRVKPVSLGQALPYAVVLRPPTRPNLE